MKVDLTREQAEMLLAPLEGVSVLDVTVAATTNNVFRVSTGEHGVCYVRFHTAGWYSDHPDAWFVVERECAVIVDSLDSAEVKRGPRHDRRKAAIPRSVHAV